MKLVIDQALAQAVANYLQERPFKEVAGLLQELAKLQPVQEITKPQAVKAAE